MIEITGTNYKEYCNIDIVAFSFAQGGAMGEGGGIRIVDSKGQKYHTNYCRDNTIYEHLYEIIPVLKDCEIGMFHHTAPDDWTPKYMGFGNYLTIKTVYKEKFDEECKQRNFESEYDTNGDLYNQWIEIILKILEKY